MRVRQAIVSALCFLALCPTGAAASADTAWTRGGGVVWHPAAPAVPLRMEIRAAPSSRVGIGQAVRFRVRSGRAGFAHLLVRNPDGSVHFVAVNRRVSAGRWQWVGMRRDVALVARRPAGRSHVTLVVTGAPLDFAGGVVSVTSLQSALALAPSSSWALVRTRVDVVE